MKERELLIIPYVYKDKKRSPRSKPPNKKDNNDNNSLLVDSINNIKELNNLLIYLSGSDESDNKHQILSRTFKQYYTFVIKILSAYKEFPSRALSSHSDIMKTVSSFDSKLIVLKEFYLLFKMEQKGSQLILEGSQFDGTYLFRGLLFFHQYVDPLELFLTKGYLFLIFSCKEASFINYSIILMMLRYTTPIGSYNFKDIENHYYYYLKSTIHSSFSQPSFDNVVAIALLAYYEISYYRLEGFNRYLNDSIKMAQVLGFDKIDKGDIGLPEVSDDLVSVEQKKQVFDFLTFAALSLGFILNEPIINHHNFDSQFDGTLNRIPRYSCTQILANEENISQHPKLNQNPEWEPELGDCIDLLNLADNTIQMKLTSLTKEQLCDQLVNLKMDTHPYIQLKYDGIVRSFDFPYDMNRFFKDVSHLMRFCSDLCHSNSLITILSLHHILSIPLIICSPAKLHVNRVAIIDFMKAYPMLKSYLPSLHVWRDKISRI